MNTLRPALFVALSAVAWSCGPSSAPHTTPPNNTREGVDVTISSVTLADDCGTGPTTQPSEPAAAEVDEPSAGARSQVMADYACEQSSIQLRVANDSADGSTLSIQKIELIDDRGTLVAELTSRSPSRWADDTYQEWDERVAAHETLQVSYALSAPAVARGATYTVRVTVATNEGEETLEQRATLEAEASLPPDVVT